MAKIGWRKFSNSCMWNNNYHLRRTRLIVYQLAVILCVVSGSLGIAALSGSSYPRFRGLNCSRLTYIVDYVDEHSLVSRLDARAEVYNNAYIGAASYNLFAGIYVASTFGAASFFDLFWPEHKEIKSVRIACKACAILSTVYVFSSAVTLTSVTALRSAFTRGVSEEGGQHMVSQSYTDGGAPLAYKHNGRAIAAVAFVWPGFIFTGISCILVFLSIEPTERGPSPKSAHLERSTAERDPEAESMDDQSETEKQPTTIPEPSYQQSRQTETPSQHSTPAAESAPDQGSTSGTRRND